MTSKARLAFLLSAPLLMAAACTPTVRVAAPQEPITINLNVNISGDVRVRLDKEVDDLIADNPDLF